MMTMSSSLEGLVRNIIRDYFNLNIAEQLNRYSIIFRWNLTYENIFNSLIFFYRYDGTVLLIRRTEDEVVCTPSNTLSGNRGNMLLTKVLIRRYPHLFSENSECGAIDRYRMQKISTLYLLFHKHSETCTFNEIIS